MSAAIALCDWALLLCLLGVLCTVIVDMWKYPHQWFALKESGPQGADAGKEA
jgi:hypothetical protein